MFIWQLPDWPAWRFELPALVEKLALVRHDQGRLLGRMESLGFPLRDEAWLQTLTQDVVKTSAIEGEQLPVDSVRSSIARRLGMDIGALAPVDRHVEGVVDMMLDATQRFREPLTVDRLWSWHGALFPTGRSGLSRIRVAAWRDDAAGPMQVLSGPIGRETVHFTAPPAECIPKEISLFLTWIEQPGGLDPVLQAGLAHLWFLTIHPFDDGNGRIARAIGDMLLARSEGIAQRYYSLSAQIQQERSDYYRILEQTQRDSLDVTAWLQWFLGCLHRAIHGADTSLAAILEKARFWEAHRQHAFNARQVKVLYRLLDGFEGKLTTSKWAKLAKCSQDTAMRDIQALIQYGILERADAGGRSTWYRVLSDSL